MAMAVLTGIGRGSISLLQVTRFDVLLQELAFPSDVSASYERKFYLFAAEYLFLSFFSPVSWSKLNVEPTSEADVTEAMYL